MFAIAPPFSCIKTISGTVWSDCGHQNSPLRSHSSRRSSKTESRHAHEPKWVLLRPHANFGSHCSASRGQSGSPRSGCFVMVLLAGARPGSAPGLGRVVKRRTLSRRLNLLSRFKLPECPPACRAEIPPGIARDDYYDSSYLDLRSVVCKAGKRPVSGSCSRLRMFCSFLEADLRLCHPHPFWGSGNRRGFRRPSSFCA